MAEEAGLGEPLPAQLTPSAVSLLPRLSLTPALFFFPQDHIPVPYQPDSSSNPSSTTSSTPSSPAPPLPPSATPPSPLHPSPQCTRQKKNFNLPGTSMLGRRRILWGWGQDEGGHWVTAKVNQHGTNDQRESRRCLPSTGQLSCNTTFPL